jgi:L-alanine-DL-glutamate epimerase-like enolase superfamily enzyme
VRITDIREVTASIASDIRNAVIDFSQMTVSLVAVHTDETIDGVPVVGYGFHSNGRYAQGEILRSRLIPRVLSAPPDSLLDDRGLIDPRLVAATAMRNEKPGGHGDRAVAAGALDMALWDLVGKLEKRPLWQTLAERTGNRAASAIVEVYAAGGYYAPGDDTGALVAEMEGYLAAGYTHVKMKIGGAALETDRRRIEAVLAILPDGCSLAVDANGRFDLPAALGYAEALADYPLDWYEEPCDPLDFTTLAAVADVYPGVLATGENLFSARDLVNLLRYGGLRPGRDVLQVDPSLSYGLVEFTTMLDVSERFGWPRAAYRPHGGHQFNLHLAAGLGLGGVESYPRVFAPFGGFADDQVIEGGEIRMNDAPGIGIEGKAALLPLLSRVGR